jgi:hypothetical protein
MMDTEKERLKEENKFQNNFMLQKKVHCKLDYLVCVYE